MTASDAQLGPVFEVTLANQGWPAAAQSRENEPSAHAAQTLDPLKEDLYAMDGLDSRFSVKYSPGYAIFGKES